MTLAGICLVSTQVEVLAKFYSFILKLRPTGTHEHTYFDLGHFHLSICSEEVEGGLMPSYKAQEGPSRTILEFEVEAIEDMYSRVNTHAIKIVKPLKTEAWGVRSFWIEDPDGNIINCSCKA